MQLITSFLYISNLFACVTGVYEYEYEEYEDNPDEIEPLSNGARIVGARAVDNNNLPFVLGFNFQVSLQSLINL